MHHFPHILGVTGYISYLSHISYFSIFLIIISSGHLIPVPESVTLIILGYLARTGVRSITSIILIGSFSVAIFDVVLYFISMNGSKFAKSLEKKVKTTILERYAGASDEKLLSLVVASHFVPGWRFVNPIVAGVARINQKKFLLFTILSSLVYAPFYIGVGYIFHYKILFLMRFLGSFNKKIIPIIIVVSLIGFLIYLVLERRKSVYNRINA